MKPHRENGCEVQPLKETTGKTYKIGLVFKVTAMIALSIAFVSTISNLVIYDMGYKALKAEIQNKLQMLAASAVVTVDPVELSKIKSKIHEGNDTYLALQKKLQEFRDASQGKIKYVYTIAKHGEQYQYVLDAAPIEDIENHSSIGDIFSVEDYPEAPKALKGPVAEPEPVWDDVFHAWLQSGYAPIKDKNGQAIGILGIDMDVSVIKEDEKRMQTAWRSALVLAIILAVVLGVLFSTYLTKPILQLIEGTRSVAQGRLDTVVHVKRRDELGELVGSFNSMTHDLKISQETLKVYNLELENKVFQRTQELSQINKEIKDILDNMSQAIFTIDRDFKFNEQHSRFAYNIFGDIGFTDKSLLDVFFPGEERKDIRDNMSKWLTRVFEDAEAGWENLEPLQPVREVTINFTGQADKVKYIEIVFQPITDIFIPDLKERVTKVMVIVQDITEKRTLELEMEKKEQEYKDNINQIVEIIKMDQELFQDFIDECKENLVNFEPRLIALRDDKKNMDNVNILFRIMHTIKGNARAFNLERIAGEAHSLENIFSDIRIGDRQMSDELLDEVFIKLDRFNNLFHETLDIYEKIVNGKGADFGKTRNEERQKIEVETIKVKIHQINKLSELIKKADRMLAVKDSSSQPGHLAQAKVEEVKDIIKETEMQLQAIRKIELGRLYARFPRMARDLSKELGKKVRLLVSGDNIEVDKHIFDNIGDPLIHILRNSIDHGLEKPQERRDVGKPEEGTIEIHTSLLTSEMIFEIKDDGRGLDIDKIKAKAVKNGLITPEKALRMSEDEAVNLIFTPGFSTNDKVTNISGRGVGMDVVKTLVEQNLNGSILVETKKNKGLKVVLIIPLSGNQEIV